MSSTYVCDERTVSTMRPSRDTTHRAPCVNTLIHRDGGASFRRELALGEGYTEVQALRPHWLGPVLSPPMRPLMVAMNSSLHMGRRGPARGSGESMVSCLRPSRSAGRGSAPHDLAALARIPDVSHNYPMPTIKTLFGQALHCAYPGCAEPLIFEDRDAKTVVAEIAHIRSEMTNGPRYDAAYTGHIDGPDNLLLLCGKHHAPVDRHESIYPTTELLEWKRRQVETAGSGTPISTTEARRFTLLTQQELDAMRDIARLTTRVERACARGRDNFNQIESDRRLRPRADAAAVGPRVRGQLRRQRCARRRRPKGQPGRQHADVRRGRRRMAKASEPSVPRSTSSY
jgi:hypothetical protein